MRARLRDDLEASALRIEERRKIADAAGTQDLALIDRIRSLGFNPDTARVFDLIPLLHVAWSDGVIQRQERSAILKVAEARGLAPGDPAFDYLETLLEQRPSEAFMRESLAVLREMLESREATGETLVALCIDIADAAGGFFGLGNRVSSEERTTLERLAEDLGPRAVRELQRRLG